MRKSLKLLFSILFLISLNLIFKTQVIAQTISFSVSPPTTSLSLMPGERVSTLVTVVNQGQDPVFFEASAEDFIVEGTNGSISLVPESSQKFSAASWISISPKNFKIEKNTKMRLNVYIFVPPNAAPGGHYAAILLKPKNNSLSQETSVETRLGSLLYLSVSGEIIENLNAEILNQKFYEYGPAETTIKIKNLGNIHVKPFGKIILSDIFGRIIEANEIPTNNIFPESERDYKELLGTKLMMGRYKVSFEGTYGNGKNLRAEKTFWVLPWKLLMIGTFSLLLVFFSLRYVQKMRGNNS